MSAFEAYVTGCSSCSRMAPIPLELESTEILTGLVGSKYFKTGASVISFSRLLKLFACCWVQCHSTSFLSRALRVMQFVTGLGWTWPIMSPCPEISDPLCFWVCSFLWWSQSSWGLVLNRLCSICGQFIWFFSSFIWLLSLFSLRLRCWVHFKTCCSLALCSSFSPHMSKS